MSFPFTELIEINGNLKIPYQRVLERLGPLLTESRKEKIRRVVGGRNFDTAVVLEGIYDRGNISAVMRTAEALGFANFHIVETQEKFKEANRVTQGADKWVEVKKWKESLPCIQTLKQEGKKVIVTSLEASLPIDEIDFSQSCALVLGNEKDGVSKEMLAHADYRVRIPMQGFVQSFNISVAGALSLYHIKKDLERRRGRSSDLTQIQQDILSAHYYLRTQDKMRSDFWD